jgi:trehalose synthase-fused probable maltokinase
MLQGMSEHIRHARWFGGKAYQWDTLRCDHALNLPHEGDVFLMVIIEVNYIDHPSEYYQFPLALIPKSDASSDAVLLDWNPDLVIVDAVEQQAFHRALFTYVLENQKLATNNGSLVFDCGAGLNKTQSYIGSRNPGVDQSNSSIFFNEKYFMKIYRKLFLETNPEVEMLKQLTEEGQYKHVPAYRGSLVWERKGKPPVTLALMMYKLEATQDNWTTTGDELNDFLHSFIGGSFSIHELVFEHVELLAKRTAEMHKALSIETSKKGFKVEKFTPVYRKWLFEHLRDIIDGRIALLQRNIHDLDAEAQELALFFMERRDTIVKFCDRIRKIPLKSIRTRIHGDYHLGQVLLVNNDFVIIDFEGEPESSIADRKIKHSPLKDVAGMVRSFHYAVSAKLFFSKETNSMNSRQLQKAADRWFYLIRETYTETYLKELGTEQRLFASKAEINYLFLLHLLEKAIYELGYELNGRPAWIKIPLKGLQQVINELEKYED